MLLKPKKIQDTVHSTENIMCHQEYGIPTSVTKVFPRQDALKSSPTRGVLYANHLPGYPRQPSISNLPSSSRTRQFRFCSRYWYSHNINLFDCSVGIVLKSRAGLLAFGDAI